MIDLNNADSPVKCAITGETENLTLVPFEENGAVVAYIVLSEKAASENTIVRQELGWTKKF